MEWIIFTWELRSFNGWRAGVLIEMSWFDLWSRSSFYVLEQDCAALLSLSWTSMVARIYSFYYTIIQRRFATFFPPSEFKILAQ